MNKVINRKWDMITQYNKEMTEIYHKIALHYNLSDSAFWVLYKLYSSKEPCTQMKICDSYYYSKQTINSAIKNLEKAGYIRMGYEENGKINKKIGLTPLGLKVAENSVKEIIEIEDKVFSKVSETELDEIIEKLQKTLTLFKQELGNKIEN